MGKFFNDFYFCIQGIKKNLSNLRDQQKRNGYSIPLTVKKLSRESAIKILIQDYTAKMPLCTVKGHTSQKMLLTATATHLSPGSAICFSQRFWSEDQPRVTPQWLGHHPYRRTYSPRTNNTICMIPLWITCCNHRYT